MSSEFARIAGTSPDIAFQYIRKYKTLEKALDAFYSETGRVARFKAPVSALNFFEFLSKGKEEISGDNLMNLFDLAETDSMDPVWLAFACECGSKTMGIFTKDEWLTGVSNMGLIDSATNLKIVLKKTKEKFADLEFSKKVYKFSFHYSLDAGTRNLQKTDAFALWDVLLKPRAWKLYDAWIMFVHDHVNHAISKDLWYMVWDLAHTVKSDLSDFDESAAWPVAIDEFVDTTKKLILS